MVSYRDLWASSDIVVYLRNLYISGRVLSISKVNNCITTVLLKCNVVHECNYKAVLTDSVQSLGRVLT